MLLLRRKHEKLLIGSDYVRRACLYEKYKAAVTYSPAVFALVVVLRRDRPTLERVLKQKNGYDITYRAENRPRYRSATPPRVLRVRLLRHGRV